MHQNKVIICNRIINKIHDKIQNIQMIVNEKLNNMGIKNKTL